MEGKENGFTLVECIVCLAVISVLVTISYPSMSTLQDRIRFKSQLTDLVSGLQRAKIAAIRSNSFVVIQVKERGYVIFVDNGAGGGVVGDWVKQGSEKILIDCDLPDNLALTTNFSSGRTRFTGQPGMKAGSLFLRSVNGTEAKVVINTVGRIRS